MYPIRHTELVNRKRPSRVCEACGLPATLTVSRWSSTAEGSAPSASRFFCASHELEARALLTHLQDWRAEAWLAVPAAEWVTTPPDNRVPYSLQQDHEGAGRRSKLAKALGEDAWLPGAPRGTRLR
jgi:hypothetical protein